VGDQGAIIGIVLVALLGGGDFGGGAIVLRPSQFQTANDRRPANPPLFAEPKIMGKSDTEDAADPVNIETVPSSPGGISGLWSRYRRLPRNVFAISLVSLLNDVSSEIIYPLLPFFLNNTLGVSARVLGSIEGTAESVSSLLKLFAGHFSDRFGKRKIFVVPDMCCPVSQAPAGLRHQLASGAGDSRV